MLTRAVLVRRLLIVGTIVLLAAPAAASASISPTLSVSPGTVPAGSAATSIGFEYQFNPSVADTLTRFETLLPPGLLINLSAAGGGCLTAPAPQPACAIGTGTASASSGTWKGAVGLYLVDRPSPGDVAGIALTNHDGETLATADVTMRSATDPNGPGLEIDFTGVSGGGLSGLDLNLDGLRTPSTCPSTPADAAVLANGSLDGPKPVQATAPLAVTGCAALAYQPSIAVHANRDASDSGVELIASVSQPNAAVESATQALELDLPTSVLPNTLAQDVCLQGSPCPVGAATATSSALPASLLGNGTVTLGGIFLAPTLTVYFPSANLTLVGTIDATNDRVTFANLPDLPLTGLLIDITGPGNRKAFQTTCWPGSVLAKFVPQDGNSLVRWAAPVAFKNCPPPPPPAKPPHVSGGSLTGLTTGKPKLQFIVRHGADSPAIGSISIAPPHGLKFKRCRVSRHRCNGLSLSAGLLKSVKLSGGQLVITLTQAVPRTTITVGAPSLSEGAGLLKRARRHKVTSMTFGLTAVDAARTAWALVLTLRP